MDSYSLTVSAGKPTRFVFIYDLLLFVVLVSDSASMIFCRKILIFKRSIRLI